MSPSSPSLLSQRDIDSLLPGQAPEAEPSPAPRLWNFARPLPLSRPVHARLEAVHDRFLRALEVHLATVLQLPIEVVSGGVETVSGAELASALETPGAAFVIRVAGAQPGGVLDLGNELALALVERLLGGSGHGAPPRRALTAFEQALIRHLAEQVLRLLGEAWSTVQPTTIECGSFAADPELIGLSAEDVQLVTHAEVLLAGERRDLAVALPIAALGSRIRDAAPSAGAASRAQIEDRLKQASAEVRVRFPELRLSARALLALAPGQIVHTLHPADAPFDLLVNGRVVHRGALGQLHGHVGVRISETVKHSKELGLTRVREGRIV